MAINRSAILQQLQAHLIAALTDQAEVILLAKENLDPLANQPQVLIKLLSEQTMTNNQQATHEQRPSLQTTAYKHKALQLELSITAVSSDALGLLALVDNIANSSEQVLLDSEQAVPWQNINFDKSVFVITEQGGQFLATISQPFSLYCINQPAEEADFPEITEVYLGQKDSDYHLISSLIVQNSTAQAAQELSI